jgi:hypothetical protein
MGKPYCPLRSSGRSSIDAISGHDRFAQCCLLALHFLAQLRIPRFELCSSAEISASRPRSRCSTAVSARRAASRPDVICSTFRRRRSCRPVIAGLQRSLAAASTSLASPRPCVAVTERQTVETDSDMIAALNQRLAAMAGTTILYVGGHPHQIAQLRFAASSFGATFIHHDGGHRLAEEGQAEAATNEITLTGGVARGRGGRSAGVHRLNN